MTLAQPFWLILLIPWAMLLWQWRLPSRLLVVLRSAALSLLLLALCGLSLVLPDALGHGGVGGRSQPLDAAGQRGPARRRRPTWSTRRCPPSDKLAVVSFAETAAVEQSPQAARFTGFSGRGGARRLAAGRRPGPGLLADWQR